MGVGIAAANNDLSRSSLLKTGQQLHVDNRIVCSFIQDRVAKKLDPVWDVPISNQPFHVISGFRSAGTNAFLRAHTGGVAENSLHLVGKAIDIRLPGRDTRSLQKAAMAQKLGGVGYYPKSDFVHIDIGAVRYW